MDLLSFFEWLNTTVLALPATIIFFGTALFLTLKTGFVQIWGFSHFLKIIKKGVELHSKHDRDGMKTINPFHAMFTAMSTTMGMGNIVGPSIAIIAGGPGALFWLLVYTFFGSVTKFVEVSFALYTRLKLKDGYIVGGPMQYLKFVHPLLAYWYGGIMVFLFAGWSATQSNTLAQIYLQEGVPVWVIGVSLVFLLFTVLSGGAERVGNVASRLVPFMFFLYVSFSFLILFRDLGALKNAIYLVFSSILSPTAAVGGFVGATAFHAMRSGLYQGVFITEAGLGTSSIPHSVSDAENPFDQGILALFSTISDATLSLLSGLLVLVTGVWTEGGFRSTLIYEAFKMHSPHLGKFVLMMSLTLLVLTTVIGNGFNGMRSFGALTKHRWMNVYFAFMLIMVFGGAFMKVQLVWAMMGTLITIAAVPNLIGVIILAIKYPKVLKP